ncbi:43173_t:CDS:2 [Gigaspora margarita]|uniref:43173_t:CDS:1 n=1 Tax=Gigaspora margarita TaxID=4874 RepID=A0ABM8W6K8_GIGMA|nr:43173_t:CDS:2 [Gigaspora margarita]
MAILEPQQLQHFLQTISRPEHDENLWSNSIIRVSRIILTLSNYVESPVEMEDIVFEKENICNLDITSDVNTLQNETYNDKLEEELQINLKNNDFDPENLQETILNDALNSIEGKNKPEHIAKWPNNTY